MTVTDGLPTSFDSLDPSTGAVVATFPVHTADEVEAAVGRGPARRAGWRALSFDGRSTRLHASARGARSRLGFDDWPQVGRIGSRRISS
jgi:acyl-CoA reductase-like NAD-dependent aldehyde dehydrogenase